MKKFIAIAALLTTLAGCSASTAAAANIKVETASTATTSKVEQGLWNPSGNVKPLTLLAKQALARKVLVDNTHRVTTITKKLSKTVGKTWYVFSGWSPKYGWDCSGLVMWYYKQLGRELHHSAFAQKYSAKPHKYKQAKAKVGDIIAFPGHVGIYVGNGYMIHSPHPGVRTQRTKVWQWAKENGTSNVTYTRLSKPNRYKAKGLH
jgi:cell wall-associated NlpC family hydrolase